MQETDWKQYLACFPRLSREVYVQNCTCKAVATLYKEETPNPSIQMPEKTDHSSTLKEQLWHRSFALSSLWGINCGDNWHLGKSSVLHLKGEKIANHWWHLDELLDYQWGLKSFLSLSLHSWRRDSLCEWLVKTKSLVNVSVSLWTGQPWQRIFLKTCSSIIVHHGLSHAILSIRLTQFTLAACKLSHRPMWQDVRLR